MAIFGRRAACLGLALLLTFFSYRPLTSMLAIAGFARNPSEGSTPRRQSETVPRENMPRPAKIQQLETRGAVVRKIHEANPSPADERILVEAERMGLRPGVLPTLREAREKIGRETSKPDYLRLFLPSAPGSPHSPPA